MSLVGESSDVFSAISAPARRAIMARLSQREMPVQELAESFSMTLSAISQHLSVLRSAGLVTTRKAGRQRIYRLTPAPLREVAEFVATYEEFWSDKFADLREYLDENP
jgi:DNA-binding transcriptional ArsR family regulator